MKRDVLAAAASLSALLIVSPPWPFWAAWGAICAWQVSKYVRRP
jgi:hypothetical protein